MIADVWDPAPLVSGQKRTETAVRPTGIESMTRQTTRKMREMIGAAISIALSIPALLLAIMLFYGIVLTLFRYAFGVELWNPFQGSGAGMGG
jgi:hypothetical protein